VRRRPRGRRLGLAASLALATVLATFAMVAVRGAKPAGAMAPDQQGWWTSLNAGSVPEVGSLPSPTPPDVPAQGLLVEGPSGSPVAYAALVYYLPVGATASTLTLTVAANSASTPKSTLELCPLVNPVLNPEQGGPTSDAPGYDCAKNVSAGPDSEGSGYQFQVSSFVSDGSLAVAILPTGLTDRVVFDQPDANSLAVQSPPASAPSPTQSPSSGVTPNPTAGTPIPGATALPTLGISDFGATPNPAPGAGAAASTGSAPPAAAAPAQASPRPYAAIPVFRTLEGDNASPLMVALVVAGLSVGGALWLISGRRRAGEGEGEGDGDREAEAEAGARFDMPQFV
jgi:hypothetical protein